MQVVRIYTGEDGESHFAEIDLPYEKIAAAERTAVENAESIHFRRYQPGNFIDWHPAPRRQYVICLAGSIEIGLGDGTTHLFGPGDARLVEDTTGKGHTTKVADGPNSVTATIPLAG